VSGGVNVLRASGSRTTATTRSPVAAVFEYSLPAAAPDPYRDAGNCEAFYRNRAVAYPNGHIRVWHAWRMALRALVLVFAVLLAGCGSDAGPPSAAPRPERQGAALRGSPPALAALHAQSNQLLAGGPAAFRARLRELRGHPVVVNKWASWCGPCRAEFPVFQRLSAQLGGRVAFLGVDANDNDSDARSFLRRYPVSYPSYSDPDQKVARVFNATLAFPTTAFYDARGRLTFVHQGPYGSDSDLRKDITRYAE
jgi:cytochrome c biogenesis protein CcmG/thiol:disulfide interchange protein DsbE